MGGHHILQDECINVAGVGLEGVVLEGDHREQGQN
jgi:hypothetical protein